MSLFCWWPRVTLWRVILLSSLVVQLSGCGSYGEKAEFGALLGGAAGALVGSQIDDGAGGVVIGAALGGFFGYQLGQYMDQRDKQRLAKSLEQTPTGETDSWTNEDSGKEFEVTPTSDLYTKSGEECREFTQVVIVNGEEKEVQGTACKAPDAPDWNVA